MKLIHVYVAAMCSAAVLLLAALDWPHAYGIGVQFWDGLAVLFALGLLSESLTVRFQDPRGGGTHTITFLPLLASVLLFDPGVTVMLFGVTGAFAEFVIRRKPLIRATFNVAQYVVAASAGGLAYAHLQTLGHLAGYGALPDGWVESIVWPFLGFAVVFFAVNHAAVSLAISISGEAPFTETWRSLLGKSGAGIAYDLLISPIAVLLAFLYIELQWPGLLLAFLPLLFIRHAYLINYRLAAANQDLLRALVKAIETRDPYTSGHSQRVAGLARRIAESLRLPPRKITDIETAALLHDIGKIEAVYTEILRKPDNLTAEERDIIESHVAKGVELLTSLSSFSGEVIAAVRHHHEREDGKGYPDRLRGQEIPLGAKIIKVCDAIDAMLSDRPYRSALSLHQVKEQLVTYAGIQFDAGIVQAVVESSVLEDHQHDVVDVREGVGVGSWNGERNTPAFRDPLSQLSQFSRRLVGKHT